MDTSRTLLASLVVVAFAAFPATALAGALVPPGNSAANQYTETFPTTGGNAEAKKGKVTPGDVLGAANAHKLDSQGKQGREAAAVVAATAPPPASAPAGDESSGSGSGAAKGNGGSGGGSDGGAVNGGSGGSAASPSGSDGPSADEPSGSSGFGEVLGQATGAGSAGGTGLLLPLVVLASAVWALVFFLRRKRPTA